MVVAEELILLNGSRGRVREAIAVNGITAYTRSFVGVPVGCCGKSRDRSIPPWDTRRDQEVASEKSIHDNPYLESS